MIGTSFLIKQSDTLNKSFNSLNVSEVSAKRLTKIQKVNLNIDVSQKTRRTESFFISTGRVELYHSNQIFNLEHIPGNVDVVLPKVKNMFDWVVLWYDQDKTIFNVSYERHSKVKIYGNGSRIMGFDEPLICDMPFMTLRLTFVNDIDGWIVT